MSTTRPLKHLSDEELADALREQVNKSRYSPGGHDRVKTQNLAAEARARGWLTRVPKTSKSSKP